MGIQEKKLIGRYFDEISQDTGKYCFGVDDTLKALEMGAVETLICWENRDIQRVTLKNHATGEEKILFLNSEQEKDKTHFMDQEPGGESVRPGLWRNRRDAPVLGGLSVITVRRF